MRVNGSFLATCCHMQTTSNKNPNPVNDSMAY
jgi:hypothetical protein